jgi:hypothetical protein
LAAEISLMICRGGLRRRILPSTFAAFFSLDLTQGDPKGTSVGRAETHPYSLTLAHI